MTPEREYFNTKFLPEFISEFIHPNFRVVDIGKPNDGWGYKSMFGNVEYSTLDRDKSLNPDILDDIERTDLAPEIFDIAICHGVWEQCDDPFALARGTFKILKRGGKVAAGILGLAYPEWQDLDRIRFTPQGALHLFVTCGFHVIRSEFFRRMHFPGQLQSDETFVSEIFLVAEKP